MSIKHETMDNNISNIDANKQCPHWILAQSATTSFKLTTQTNQVSIRFEVTYEPWLIVGESK